MKIAIIDADLIGRKRHRFPNLACMKLAGYHKGEGDEVNLKADYNDLDNYDKIYISKVFTNTPVPDTALVLTNLSYGGTGFYYDKAPRLPDEIEHHMPDYHLYDDWVSRQIVNGRDKREFAYYTDYSIGFLTRGCFRHCPFCVNQNYEKVEPHSPLDEFIDKGRNKICLMDDNFFGSPSWKEMLTELQNSGKPFQFKQGLDARLLDDEKCELLFKSRYDSDYIFAYDDIADTPLIEGKLRLIRKYTDKIPKFYCFTGFDRSGRWDNNFWRQDIFDLLSRIGLLMKYRCLPYVMRFSRYSESPYRGVYVSIARWCNQPQLFKKKTLREFMIANGEGSACYKYMKDFENDNPDISHFYDLLFE